MQPAPCAQKENGGRGRGGGTGCVSWDEVSGFQEKSGSDRTVRMYLTLLSCALKGGQEDRLYAGSVVPQATESCVLESRATSRASSLAALSRAEHRPPRQGLGPKYVTESHGASGSNFHSSQVRGLEEQMR